MTTATPATDPRLTVKLIPQTLPLFLLSLFGACMTANEIMEPAPECSLYPGERNTLRAVDPYLLPNLRSTDQGGETAIIFVNCTESEIAYYWVDRDGAERYYGRLAPNSEAIQHSFEGHVWVVKDNAASNLSVFRATRSISLAVVTTGRGSRPESQRLSVGDPATYDESSTQRNLAAIDETSEGGSAFSVMWDGAGCGEPVVDPKPDVTGLSGGGVTYDIEVQFRLDASGLVTRVDIVRGGSSELNNAVLTAARGMRFDCTTEARGRRTYTLLVPTNR